MHHLPAIRKYVLLLASVAAIQLFATSCERKLPSTKERLEKALADQLSREAPARKFTVEDVTWFEETDHYDCEFKVSLHRDNGTDTTGLIKGTVSKDFTVVSKR